MFCGARLRQNMAKYGRSRFCQENPGSNIGLFSEQDALMIQWAVKSHVSADSVTVALHVSQHDTVDLLEGHMQGLSVIFASSQHLLGLTCTYTHQVSSAWLTRLLMPSI